MAPGDAPYLLVVDLEATCDDRGAVPKHEMETIEIGAVLVDRLSLETLGEFQTFIRPVRHPALTDFCRRLTSIGQSDVDGAPRFPAAIERLYRFVGSRHAALCSWGDQDKRQLAQDAMHDRVELRLRNHMNLKVEFGARVGSSKKFGLGEALQHVGLTFEGTAHRGIDDARNIVRLLPWIFGSERMAPT